MATDLMTLVAKIGLDDSEYKDGLKGAEKETGGFAKVVGTAFKGVGVAVGAAATAIGAIGKKAIESYSDYEQLAGGVKKLYGDASDEVMKYAQNAYKTAGMSANQYMEQATGFSAALINSLGGDQAAAAKQTDKAMRAISDNYNTFGGDMQNVQNAFQGFAKQNYSMLDNLKLGYGGTKTEMERLIKDANEYAKANGQAANLSIDSFSDVVTAIDLIQQKQHIAGTTAKEAGTTIQGSIGMAKSAWENLLTGLSDPDADVGKLVGNLVTSIVGDGTDTNKGVLGNLIPAIKTTLGSIGKLVQGLGDQIIPQLVQLLPSLLEELLPQAISLVENLFKSVGDIIPQLIPVLLEALPLILQAGLSVIMALVQGITENIPVLLPAIVQVVTDLALMLTEPDMLVKLISAALDLLIALGDGLIKAIPQLIAVVPKIIINLVKALIRLAPKLVQVGKTSIKQLIKGLTSMLSAVGKAGATIFNEIKKAIKNKLENAKQWGKDLIANFIKGIKDKWNELKSNVTAIADYFKKLFKHSTPDYGPMKDDDKWMPDFMDNLIYGIDSKIPQLQRSVDVAASTIGDEFAFDGGTYGDEYVNDTQRFEFTFADGNAPLLQIARLLFPYMQVVSKEKGVRV